MKLMALIAAPVVALLVTALPSAATRLPDGWLRAGDARDCHTRVEPLQTDPARGLVIECPPCSQGFTTVMQMVAAQHYAGKRVRLSAELQGDLVQGWGGLWLRGDVEGSSRVLDNMQTRPLRGSFAWRSAEVVLQLPAEVDRIGFGVLLDGAGTLRASQIKLELVPESVPLTPGLLELPAQPQNLSLQ